MKSGCRMIQIRQVICRYASVFCTLSFRRLLLSWLTKQLRKKFTIFFDFFVRPGSDAVLHMSRIECKWGRTKDFAHLHSIRLMWSTASELGLKLDVGVLFVKVVVKSINCVFVNVRTAVKKVPSKRYRLSASCNARSSTIFATINRNRRPHVDVCSIYRRTESKSMKGKALVSLLSVTVV